MSRIAGIFPCFVWYCRLVGQICCMLAHIHRASFLRHRRQHHLFCYYGEHSSLNGVYHVCVCVWNFVQQHEVPTHMMALHHVPYHTHAHTLRCRLACVGGMCAYGRHELIASKAGRPSLASSWSLPSFSQLRQIGGRAVRSARRGAGGLRCRPHIETRA